MKNNGIWAGIERIQLVNLLTDTIHASSCRVHKENEAELPIRKDITSGYLKGKLLRGHLAGQTGGALHV